MLSLKLKSSKSLTLSRGFKSLRKKYCSSKIFLFRIFSIPYRELLQEKPCKLHRDRQMCNRNEIKTSIPNVQTSNFSKKELQAIYFSLNFPNYFGGFPFMEQLHLPGQYGKPCGFSYGDTNFFSNCAKGYEDILQIY